LHPLSSLLAHPHPEHLLSPLALLSLLFPRPLLALLAPLALLALVLLAPEEED